MKVKRCKKDSGFTLIELLIVIAIIGILAAIAIPQFAKYRTRAYNSAALSDLRNLQQTEAAFYADWQTYGSTNTTSGTTAVITGPTSSATIYAVDANNNHHSSTIGVSKNVSLYATGSSTNYAAVAKHLNGDKTYGGDSQESGVFYKPAKVGSNVTITGITPLTTFSTNSTWNAL